MFRERKKERQTWNLGILFFSVRLFNLVGTRGKKPGFCREDALQLAETAKNPVSWVSIRKF